MDGKTGRAKIGRADPASRGTKTAILSAAREYLTDLG